MKPAFLARERREAGFIDLGSKKGRHTRCFFREKLCSSKWKTAGAKKESASASRIVLRDKPSVLLLPVLGSTDAISGLAGAQRAHASQPGTLWPWDGLSRQEGARQAGQVSVTVSTAWWRPASLSQQGGKSCHKRLRAMRRRAKGV